MSGFLTTFSEATEVIHRSISPVDNGGATPDKGILANKLEDLEQIVKRGIPVHVLQDVPTYIDAIKNMKGRGLDDRLFLLEKLVTLMSRLPDDSQLAVKMQHKLIDTLYKDLPHPPASYVSNLPVLAPVAPLPEQPNYNVDYPYRSEDGSNYNVLFPNMGRAGMPYARSVAALNPLPRAALPDAGLVFDNLLKRDRFETHPGGLSSLFFAFANLVIHSIFDTRHGDPSKNDASSYLDLSPLYGGGEGKRVRKVSEVRAFDGKGHLIPDVFGDGRVLAMPPSTGALLILFNRNHNYIAQKLFDINERGTFKDPASLDDKKRQAQDDEIFHRARLVNTGFFMQIILQDYVGAILGLTRDGLAWRLNPLETMRDDSHEFSPVGQGNVVSIEFNQLYRWHSTISEADVAWTEDLIRRKVSGKPFERITPDDFMNAARGPLQPPASVRDWTVGDLQRGDDGKFADGDLAKILQDATDWAAGAYKARGIPGCMRVVEVMGIESARAWGSGSINEFRKFLGLKPYASFTEWNRNPEIARAAEKLYGKIENLELYVGLHAEEAKPAMPGAGLCPGYTISRAILSDAVALVRGDRFLTSEFTPYNLSSWGYLDCQAEHQDGSYGGILSKLLFRSLPDYYPAGSVYGHFPFITPTAIKQALIERGENVNKYIWQRPRVSSAPVPLKSYADVELVLKPEHFGPASRGFATLTKGIFVDQVAVVERTLKSDKWLPVWAEKLDVIVRNLLRDQKLVDNSLKEGHVDVVQHVINWAPIILIANEITGLPLKNEANPRGVWREQELYEKFAAISNYVLFDYERQDDWKLRVAAEKAVEELYPWIKGHLGKASGGLFSVSGITDTVRQFVSAQNDRSGPFLNDLLHAAGSENNKIDSLAYSLLSVATTTTAAYSAALAQVVDYYLDDARNSEQQLLVSLSGARDAAADRTSVSLIHEAMRHNPPASAVYRTAKANVQVGVHAIPQNARVLASLVDANADPTGSKVLYNLGAQGLLGDKFLEATAPRILQRIFSLKNVRRTDGNSGQLLRFTQDLYTVKQTLFIDMRGAVSPFPSSLIIEYDV